MFAGLADYQLIYSEHSSKLLQIHTSCTGAVLDLANVKSWISFLSQINCFFLCHISACCRVLLLYTCIRFPLV